MGPVTQAFDASFEQISQSSRKLIERTPPDLLFRDPREYESTAMCSVGEYVVRSAAMVERAFGGLTRRLWDDPFEWTLPEELFAPERILGYLDEVDEIRRSGLLFLQKDEDLSRQLPAPVKLRSVADILIEAVGLARHYQGRAFALYQAATDAKLPQL